MRHGRAAFLSLTKIFFNFENFSSLQMTKFCCPAIDAGSDHGQRRHELGMPVTLHDLGRQRRRFQPELFTDSTFNFWIDMCVRPNRAADFSNANAFECLGQSFLGAPKFVEHQR